VKNLPIRPLLCLVSLCALPTVSRAEPPNLFEFRAGAGVEHNTNVLASPTQEQSDDISILSVGVKAERDFGLQHFKADVEYSKYYYRNLSNLDYSALNYAIALDWRVTPALHGVLGADQREFRDISDISGRSEIGVRTEHAELAEAIYDIDGAWRALAGIGHTATSSTVPLTWDASPTVRSWRVGGGYEWASGSSLFARFRRGDGEYQAAVLPLNPGGFREDEAELLFKWALTGKTTLDARLAHLDRQHPDAPIRDFSGPVGSAAVNWEATGKTRVIAGAYSDLGSSGIQTGGHVRSNRFFIGPVWRATAHTTVNARYDRIARSWQDILPGLPQSGRRDTIQIGTIGVDWTPRRIVTVSASVRGERVDSNVPGASYRNTAVGLAVKVSI